MSRPPIDIATFNAYKAALARGLAPAVASRVRGIEVRLSFGSRHLDVVLHQPYGSEMLTSQTAAAALDTVSAILGGFDDFAGFTTAVRTERCDPAEPIVYRGCPVWARKETRWSLAPDLAARVAAAQRGEGEDRVAGP